MKFAKTSHPTRSLCVLLAIAGVAMTVALGPTAIASGHKGVGTEPTLTLQRHCEAFPGFPALNSFDVFLTGLPPFTPFEATVTFPDGGGIGPVDRTTDGNGNFTAIAPIGSAVAGVWTLTIVWEGGTLTSSIFVDCSQPDVPTSKGQCKHGGWRDFPQFKNQGRCVAFVNHNP